MHGFVTTRIALIAERERVCNVLTINRYRNPPETIVVRWTWAKSAETSITHNNGRTQKCRKWGKELLGDCIGFGIQINFKAISPILFIKRDNLFFQLVKAAQMPKCAGRVVNAAAHCVSFSPSVVGGKRAKGRSTRCNWNILCARQTIFRIFRALLYELNAKQLQFIGWLKAHMQCMRSTHIDR